MKKIHYIVLTCLCLAVACAIVIRYVYKSPIEQDEYAGIDTTHLIPLFTAEDTWVSATERIVQMYWAIEEQEPGAEELGFMLHLVLTARFHTTHKDKERFNKEPLPKYARKFLNQIIITRQIPKPE